MRSNFFHNKTKMLFQIAIILLIVVLLIIGFTDKTKKADFEAYCPFGGLVSLGSKFQLGSMSCNMNETQVFMGIFLLIGVILFGKLFCGYICPIGTLTEWLNKLFARFKFSIILKGKLDRILRLGKYVLLFFTAYFTSTASELWCKKFDPYYAVVSGFDSDTVLPAGIATLLTVLVLSVFIRFFWCKYVCPLGALSNIFSNILITAPILIVYFGLHFLGINLHILWLIAALCLSGALTEMLRFKFFSISPFRVTIDKNTCTACGNCDDNCPQGIPVSSYERVTHPDCTLCMDCTKECSGNGSIQLNRSNHTWIPPVALVGLFLLALITARNFEFKTLSERWGNFSELKTVQKFEMKDLQSVKCWGSSKSLQNKLLKNSGIVGLDTYAKTHKITVYYDSSKIDEHGVKKAIFTPYQYKLQKFNRYQPDQIAVFEIPINGLWDLQDNTDLIRMLRVNQKIVGFETNFGEPVLAKIYTELGQVAPDSIIYLIEQKSYQKNLPDGKTETVKVNFRCEGRGAFTDTLDYTTFRRNLFSGYDQTYNHYENYKPADLMIFEIGFPDAESIALRRALKYLTSHVSFFDGTVRLRTAFTNREVLQVYFDPKQVSAQQILAKLNEPKLKILMSDDETKEMDNAFQFLEPVKTYPVTPDLYLEAPN
jgi:Pyruvate/2-oxoacid:ferredoxin oxidoreductase delta subunit